MGKIVFSYGGEYHRPGRPHVFPDGLKAAAYYLKAVEEVDRSVRKQLREIFKTHLLPRHLLSWEIVPLSEEELAVATTPEPSTAGCTKRFKLRWSFLEAFQDWLDKHHLWSPHVLDLLDRTLQLWNQLRKERSYLEATISDWQSGPEPLTEKEQKLLVEIRKRVEFLTSEEKGWGWWVNFLTSDITIPQLDSWLAGHGLCPPSVPGTQLLNMPSSPSKAALWIFERLKRYASKTHGVSSLSIPDVNYFCARRQLELCTPPLGRAAAVAGKAVGNPEGFPRAVGRCRGVGRGGSFP